MDSGRDSWLEWLASSPVTQYISEMEVSEDSTAPYVRDQIAKNSTTLPIRPHSQSGFQNQRRPSYASYASAPGMVMDMDAPSPGASCAGDEYNYHSSSDAIWDLWLEDDVLSDPQIYTEEEGYPHLQAQHSNLALRMANAARSELTKMRSIGDFRRPSGTMALESRYRAGCTGPSSSLHSSKYDKWDTDLPHDGTIPIRPHSDPVSAQSVTGFVSGIHTCALLEPRPQHTIPSINTSLYTATHPSEWLSQDVQPVNPPSVGEKSVFEDWDEPKGSFWRLNRKRKRSTNSSGSEGNGNNKSPKKMGGRLWNLALLVL
jgi:hypothetical protein